MNEVLAGLNLGLLAPGALLGLAVYLILRGHLVPRATLEDAKKVGENWREAYENERSARSLSEGQTGELLQLARATNALLVALPKVGDG